MVLVSRRASGAFLGITVVDVDEEKLARRATGEFVEAGGGDAAGASERFPHWGPWGRSMVTECGL